MGGCYSGVSTSQASDSDTDTTPGAEGEGEGGDTDGGGDSEDSGGEDAEVDVGRVTLHRLNRAEYNNTIRDLFYGLDVSPADVFPADDHSFGFDNIADALNTTPLLVELYERAAEQVLDEAFAAPAGEPMRVEAETAGGSAGAECCGGFWNLTTNGTIDFAVDAEVDGDYALIVRAAGQDGPGPAPNMVVTLDGAEQLAVDVIGTVDAPEDVELDVSLTAGAHVVTVEFTNDTYDPDAGIDTNLLVDYVDLIPPAGEGGVRDQLVACAQGEPGCTDETVRTFAERAWRRPLTDEELAELVAFVEFAQDDGETWDEGLKLAMKAALLSPHFIFRVEIDPEPQSLEPHLVSDFELASRLSYFLWSSMPDDALFELARAGELNDPDAIAQQVERMLADPKASALAENFAGQWLYTRALNEELVKDSQTYPDFDTALREDMRTEMELLIAAVIEEGRGLDELFNGRETFVNDRLAAFYGLPPVGTDDFVRVSLEGTNRKGLLTTGGLMSVLAHPNVTSPIKRGKWVVEQLLCIEPPPPPPDAETTVDPSFDEGPMRDRLAKHREDPSCAACHELMDPPGLAFEHYDGIGAWRDMEGPYEIDPSGTLPIGGDFADALEMVDLIASSEEFSHCVAEKVLLYGLGRGIEKYDEDIIGEAADAFSASGYQLQTLITQLATSDNFRMRRGEAE
ncbi:MAG: DUF1592 domain-containing protein [Nannocystaceae bacterium]|nr:DUF1592 domain-containing protein [bacterium]